MNINVYCDESCHLLNDGINIMTLGAIQYPKDAVREMSIKVKELKKKFNCLGELKWTKVSDKKIDFYKKLIDLYAEDDQMFFRSVIIKDKDRLGYDDLYNYTDHDNFYYKMYYYLLKNILEYNTNNIFRTYIDIKDTNSSLKVSSLKKYLNSTKSCNKNMNNIQQIRSHESNLLQLCDFLLGCVTYANRLDNNNYVKREIYKYLESKVSVDLTEGTPPWERKINLFHFSPTRKI